MKKILLCTLVACNYIAQAQQNFYSKIQFVNNSDLSFDFSLLMKSKSEGSQEVRRVGYKNPAWLGKYSPDQLTNIPISFAKTPFPVETFYWTWKPGCFDTPNPVECISDHNDYIGFDLMTTTGRTMGLTNKPFIGGAHFCSMTEKDNDGDIVFNFENGSDGYILYIVMPVSTGCSFPVTDGYGPRPTRSLLNSNQVVNVTSSNIDDGRKNAELEIHDNPALLKHLDQVYFEATGIDRAKLRENKNKQLGEQVRPLF